MLVYTSLFIRNLFQLPVHLIEIAVYFSKSLFKNSIYILQRGLARPLFFSLVDGAIALRDNLAFLPWHDRETWTSRTLVCWFTLARGKVNSLEEDDVWNRVILIS